MSPRANEIDISENSLRKRGRVLDILLLDRTTKRNIIWATDSYKKYGKDYAPKKQIKREQITGLNGKLIQPRAAKSKEEQKYRTKDKAEVFTPLSVVKEMNIAIDWASKNWPVGEDNWINYISELRLEITCGEAPFIAGRYNPTANTGVVITPKNRVGFLDRKLQVVGKFAQTKKEWLEYAEVALKATYGYEWQGDNLLIARENILLTVDDFYADYCNNTLKLKTKQRLDDGQLESFAEIISWNIWQMDGIKGVIPLSCRNTRTVIAGLPLFGETDQTTLSQCPGCKINNHLLHNGRYAKIMNWNSTKRYKTVRFIDIGQSNKL